MSSEELAIWLIVCGCAFGVVGVYFKRREQRIAVFGALDNAVENGYFKAGEQCYEMTPEELAHDITCYCDDERLYGIPVERLVRYVRQWCYAKGLL